MSTTLLLHRRLEERARATPDALSLTGRGAHLTFGELNARAERLACRLRGLGVGPDVVVGLLMEKSPDLMVALYAILKAGGAYLVLDPVLPEERLAFMMDDALGQQGSRVLVADSPCAAAFPRLTRRATQVVSVYDGADADPRDDGAAEVVTSENLAYVVYTSGSTGRPKAVMICHRSVALLMDVMRGSPGLAPDDVIASINTLGFDISVPDLFLPPTVGAALALVDRETAWDGLELHRRLAEIGCTALQATPSTWRLLLEVDPTLGPIRRIVTGGEALPADVGKRLLDTGGEVWNFYGPTEATVWCTGQRLERAEASAPIGTALPGARVYVLDGRLRPVSPGELGEVYVAGEGLARGYLRRPALTAERFVPNPSAGVDGAAAGDRLYRVGDLARVRAAGVLEFAGRIDHQVKVRGFRIELGEIESTLARHPCVRQVVVTAREEEPGHPQIVAYLVLHSGLRATARSLREFLGASLPDYMMPSHFIVLEELPLSRNGKIDRGSLPVPGPERPHLQRDYVAPRTPTEEALACIFAQALHLEQVGVEDDFFELGGHSLAALHVVTGIRGRYEVDLHLGALLEAPTVAAMARRLERREDATSSNLVLLAGRGSRPPALFCVHGAGGLVFRLVPLAAAMPGDRPFFGIQAWTNAEQLATLGTIEDLARHNVEQVWQAQPEGPYLLAGYSMGAFVALEMARQLEEEGSRVGFLGVLDTAALEIASSEGLEDAPFEVILAQELRVPVDIDQLQAVPAQDRLEAVVSQGVRENILPSGFTSADAASYLRRFQATFLAITRYRPSRCPVRVTLFASDEIRDTEEFRSDPTLGWGGLAGGGVEIVEVPGTHVTMLHPPRVHILADHLAAALTGAVEIEMSRTA